MQNEYEVGSLFSGGGGIEIGFEKQGFKTRWFVEKEPYAREILKKRFPETTIYGDITEIDFRTVPKIDILTGGFPCQDISVAGKQVGIEGSRSALWKYYSKAIRILRPKFALIENVSALTIRGLNVVLSDLAKIGYDAEWYNISASAVGAFHQRERIFIIAYPNIERFKEQRRTKPNEEERAWAKHNHEIPYSDWRGMWKQKLLQGNTVVGLKAKPRICGVANGIPNRVDRIKCLGNAVVPQCAEVFAKAIKMRLLNEGS